MITHIDKGKVYVLVRKDGTLVEIGDEVQFEDVYGKHADKLREVCGNAGAGLELRDITPDADPDEGTFFYGPGAYGLHWREL